MKNIILVALVITVGLQAYLLQQQDNVVARLYFAVSEDMKIQSRLIEDLDKTSNLLDRAMALLPKEVYLDPKHDHVLPGTQW